VTFTTARALPSSAVILIACRTIVASYDHATKSSSLTSCESHGPDNLVINTKDRLQRSCFTSYTLFIRLFRMQHFPHSSHHHRVFIDFTIRTNIKHWCTLFILHFEI